MSEHWRPTDDDGERISWFAADQPRHELPRYLRKTKRLKSLDEFEPPEFVGRMKRVERRRRLEWYGMLAAAVTIGGAIGFLLF